MSDVVVVTPTVPQRAATREATLAQWRALGLDPIVVEQQPALPVGHASQAVTARAALAAGVATGSPVIVYAEDDIDVDPRIARLLPALIGRSPCSLWHRPRFAPSVVRGPDQVVVAPARTPGRWWSSMCVVLTRAQAAAWAQADCRGGGIDIGLRGFGGLRVTVPPLVAHRRLPRVASRGTWIDAVGYEGPRTREDAAC